ncbi:MAG TPA: Pls/PosA family non-ribosomal peptide synthetase, partial [Sporichthyaceae bacterium]
MEQTPPMGTNPTTTVETDVVIAQEFARILAELLTVDAVGHDEHFFDDLGADSMVMAQFCSRVRKRPELPKVSMKDIYGHSTINGLAGALGAAPVAVAPPAPAPAGDILIDLQALRGEHYRPAAAPTAPKPRVATAQHAATAIAVPIAGRLRLVAVGLVQFVVLMVPLFVVSAVGTVGYHWIGAGHGVAAEYLRSVGFLAACLGILFVLPILAKWTLIGRFKPREIKLWSLGYLRFWLVRSLIQRNPLLHLMMGSPLYGMYLRLLGAKVGPGALILTRNIPVCTDLIRIGAGAVVRKDTILTGYHAEPGLIRTGFVRIGANAVVGDNSVLGIDTEIGAGAHLGHASSLHSGQVIPHGENWHGSPAQADGPAPVVPEERPVGRLRRFRFAAGQVLTMVFVTAPLGLGIAVGLSVVGERLAGVDQWGRASMASPGFYARAALTSAAVFFGVVLIGLPLMFGVARLLSLPVRPERTYPTYGCRHTLQRAVVRLTNVGFYTHLFGDSSAIVGYLGRLGYRLKPCEQTGTNFGLSMKHETPFTVHIGTGTVVADGLSVLNTEFSASSFRVRRVHIGRNNFLGNNIPYPAEGRTGDNCLLATKVAIPVDGEIRQGVGLLGSPAFEIPRTVARDTDLAANQAAVRVGLRRKNRHNAVTVALFLTVRWLYVFGIVLYADWAGQLYLDSSWAGLGLANLGLAAGSLAYWLGVERSVTLLSTWAPQGVSIYDRRFWRHERFWKVPTQQYVQIFNGTPMKPWLWRALGARVGRGVFDDGMAMIEKALVTIGSGAVLNVSSVVQCHSQEDGAFKSDFIRIGSGSTVGPGAFVHYGVQLGPGSTLAADSFLMKGEEVPDGA